jgi:hypothetical protein
MPYYDDDGTEINEFEIEKPLLCMTCKKEDDPAQEIPCQLTRMDQRDGAEFKCYAYEKKDLLE